MNYDSQDIYNKLYPFFLYLIAALLPFTEYFNIQFLNISIIFLFGAWLFLYSGEGLKKVKYNKIIFLFISIYIIYFTGFFREGDIGILKKILIKKSPLLILPLIVGSSPKLEFRILKSVLLFFIAGVIIATLLSFLNGASFFIVSAEDLTELSSKLIIHRPYFGLFCAFGIFIILYLIIKEPIKLLKVILFTLSVYLFLFMFFIYAKMAVIAFFITFIIMCFLSLLYLKHIKIIAAFSFIATFAFIGLYLINPEFKIKAQSGIEFSKKILQGNGFSYDEYDIKLVSSINIRYINWTCAYVIIKENSNWIRGVGAANVQNNLQNCYKGRNPWILENKMNSHNQFLEEVLSNGILGLFLFISCLLIPAIKAYYNANFIYISFICLFSLCAFTESILNRQIGIIFFSFFNSLLYFNINNVRRIKD